MDIAEPYREVIALRSNATSSRLRRAAAALGVATALAAGVGALLVACSSDADRGADGPRATTTTEVGAGDDDPGATVDPDDVVVWQERSGGGLVPVSVRAAEVPSVTVYADGRTFVADRDGPSRYDHPVPLRAGRVPAGRLRAFLADVDASGLFAEGTAFGHPSVTDLATTSVTAQVGGEDRTIDVYALEPSFEEHLSGAEVDRRNDLRDLLARGRELAATTEPWSPDRVRVTDLGATDADAATTAASWPGPGFDEFTATSERDGERCLVLTGAAAPTVFDAAVSNPGISFRSGGEVRDLVVAALLPGDAGCPT